MNAIKTLQQTTRMARLPVYSSSVRQSPAQPYTTATHDSDENENAVALSPRQPKKPIRRRARETSGSEANEGVGFVSLLVSVSLLGLGYFSYRGLSRFVKRENAARTARNQVLDGYTETEVLAALDEIRKRLAEEAERARKRNMIPSPSVPTFESDSEMIKMLAGSTDKGRAMLRACLTGQVETKYLLQVQLGAGKSTEGWPMSKKWEEERGRTYWSSA